MMIRRFATLLVLAAVALGAEAAFADKLEANSRSPFVHRINLYNEKGALLKATDDTPWSPGVTCGKCHEYDTIAKGWHFNDATTESLAGRPGEPWILADTKTGTQLPLSRRGWKGTYHPEKIGLTNWEFVKRFGRHLPGGGTAAPNTVAVGEGAAQPEEDAELFPIDEYTDAAPTAATSAAAAPGAPVDNWHKAGNLEIDCMSCHGTSLRLNQSERALQIEDDNFKFVPTATSGLGVIRGSTRRMGSGAASTDPNAPKVIYNASLFDADNRVFMDVKRIPPDQRCYFCHTTRTDPVRPGAGRDVDVHLTSGMNCTDCHRHSMDHKVARGYPGEDVLKARPGASTLSCSGCHYGGTPGVEQTVAESFPESPLAGRLGSPVHDHPGLPPLHFDKLTCTACHSGPYPGEQSRLVMTSLAHELGLSSEYRSIQRPPFVELPLFVRNERGQIEPRKAVWPAFWAAQTSGTLSPLKPEDVIAAAGAAFSNSGKPGDEWKALTDEEITAALKALNGQKLLNGAPPAYVAAGMLHTLTAEGALQSVKDEVAAAYTWPLAHDVRPGSQALGARGCQDCHAADTGIYYSKTLAAAPMKLAGAGPMMFELRGEDPAFLKLWESSFKMRLTLKIVGFAACGVLALLLLAHLLRALSGVRPARGGEL